MQVTPSRDERAGEAVDDVARRDAVHALAHGLVLQLPHVLLAEALHVLAVVELQLLHQAHAGLLRRLEPARARRTWLATRSVLRRDVHAAAALLWRSSFS